MNKKSIPEIRAELHEFAEWPTIVFGSYVEGGMRPGSDIDVAIITRRTDQEKNISIFKDCLAKVREPYEIHVFELLPLQVQHVIINQHVVIFGDRVELSEYFYQTRKRWDDCKYRVLENQFTSYKEKLHLMRNRDVITRKTS